MNFTKAKCSCCGKEKELMFSNNPIVSPICFDCINDNLNYENIEHAEFFCRSYNLPMNPQLWIKLAPIYKQDTFKEYSRLFFEDEQYQNLYYHESTGDIWSLINREWEKCRSQHQVFSRLETIKESYLERARMKWGPQYTYEQLISLDSVYSQVMKSCNITNAIQKKSLMLLCKIQAQMEQAISLDDSKTLKDLSSSYSSIAKTAGLEEMIEQTKTDDITTVAELYQYMEDQGFEFKYYKGDIKDEVDFCMKDIKDTLRQTVLDSVGIGSLLEQMIKRRETQQETIDAAEASDKISVDELLGLDPSEFGMEIEEEDDSVVRDFNFDE